MVPPTEPDGYDAPAMAPKEHTMRLARWTAALGALLLATLLSGCGYNDFQRLDEQVKACLLYTSRCV